MSALFVITPKIFPFTSSINFFVFFKSFVFVFLLSAIKIVLSTIDERAILSDTTIHGVPSSKTTSYILFNKSNNLFIFSDDINSAGLGGIVPFCNICKFGIFVSLMYFLDFDKFSNLSKDISFIKSDKPSHFSTLNISFLSFSFLKSVSTKITFLPVCANATAKLFTIQLFPSFGLLLVISIVFLLFAYNIFVLIVFILSTICDFGLFSIINSFFSLSSGNLPKLCILMFLSICFSSFIVSSKRYIAITNIADKNIPAHTNIIISLA